MKICTNCQKQNVEDAVYCRFCGSKFSEQASIKDEDLNAEQLPAAPIVENITPMNKNVLKELYKKTKILGWICTGLGALFLLFGILEIILETGDQTYFLLLGVIEICCGAFLVYLERVYVNKNKFVTDNMNIIYRFYEENFCSLTYDGENKREESNLTYANISKIRKMGNYIYLYLGANALVVNVNTFTIGTKEDLVALLKKRCGQKNVKIK